MRLGAPTVRSATLPQPAHAAWLSARLSRVHFLGLKRGGKTEHARRSTSEFRGKPWLMESVSWGGVGLSAVLAGVGVIGLVGFESTLARIGSGILLGGTVLTEIAAARLPVHAQRRFAEGGVSGVVKGCSVVLGFGALTAWNVIAGHFGMVAIDSASVNDVRAPLERAAAEADAARETAEEALAAHDAEAREERESMALALRGAFESGYITSSSRNAREAAGDRAERRVDLAQAVTDARGSDRVAERALAAAPSPRPDLHLWLFACVMELIKGALVWFSTAGERKRSTQGASLGPISGDPRSMSAAERRELKSRCASVLATIRHMEAARG